MPKFYPDGIGDAPILPWKHLIAYRFPDCERHYKIHVLPPETRTDHCSVLPKLIKQTPSQEKWLIFVESKDQGRELARCLGDAARYLDSERKEGPLWDELTTKSRFSSQILVTTAVIDNGINLCDVSLKHIVLLTIDHVQFIQQLGRKRMNDGETLHVWVPDLTQNQTEKLQHRNARLLQALDHFACMTIKEKYGLRYRLWYENDAELRHLFVMGADEPLSVNACAEKVVQQRRIFYQELSAAFESGEKHPFIHHVLRWLNLPEAAIGDCEWHNTIDHEEFLEFLANYTAIPMRTKEEQEKFSMEFRRYRTAIFGPRKKGNRRSDPWGKEIISRELEELKLPFKLNIEDDAWMIRSTNQPD